VDLQERRMGEAYDILVIGAGPSGAAVAARIAADTKATVCVLEAGGGARGWRGRMPVWQASAQAKGAIDWGRVSVPQQGLGGRRVLLAGGRGVGGSDLLAPPLWLRARARDFDDWYIPNWAWNDIAPAYQEAERRMRPAATHDPDALSDAFSEAEGAPATPPEPGHMGLGLLPQTIRGGRRFMVSDAFLQPVMDSGRVALLKNARVSRILFNRWRAAGVELTDGRRVRVRAGIILCAGAVETPAILLRSGIGPSDRLRALGIPLASHSPLVGENLSVRPRLGLVHVGPRAGAGFDWRQALKWLGAAAVWSLGGEGALGAELTEAGGFLRVGVGVGAPDVEVRLRLAQPAWPSKSIWARPGITLEARLCCPMSLGRVGLAGTDPRLAPRVDPGLMAHEADRQLMREAMRRLRSLIDREEFDAWREDESAPGRRIHSEDAMAAAVAARVTSAGEMSGSCHMGESEDAPLSPDLQVRGVEGAWVCDASIFPTLPSSGLRAATFAAGWHGGGLIAQQLFYHLRDAA
jgi:choline dehydrogenase-like flavoprotein